jgi:hypothetical protein
MLHMYASGACILVAGCVIVAAVVWLAVLACSAGLQCWFECWIEALACSATDYVAILSLIGHHRVCRVEGPIIEVYTRIDLL